MRRIRETIACALLGASVLGLALNLDAAFAQSAKPKADDAPTGPIEKVVVTAEKRKANVQDVPIAVTAISGEDMSKRQIESFRDLQFNVPSVTFSKGNFAGNNFQIRGIGVSAVAASADSGVSVHTDNIYQVSTAGLAIAEYFDIDRIEVLRGPQSTLYGRNATGGVVNIITNKPDLTGFMTKVEAEYAEYNSQKFRGVVNVPIVDDMLGVRVAGIISKHDGYVENIFTGNDVDDQDLYAFRASARWEPTERTTVDFSGSYFHEDDSHVRSPKQMCHRDPTGVAGCLPDKLAFEPLNANATFGTTLASKQFWTNAFGPFFTNLGLFDLTAAPGLGATANIPQDLNTINTDFEPKFQALGKSYTLSIEHELNDWLDVTLDIGNIEGKTWSQQNYNQTRGDNIAANIAASMATFNGLLSFFGADPTVYTSTYFSSAPSATCAGGGLTCLPLSTTTNNGIGGGNVLGQNILYYSDRVSAYDQINGADDATTVELRFQSNYDGPVNFLVAGYYLTYDQWVEYYVNANTLDFSSIFLGAFVGNLVLGQNGLLSLPPFYHNDTRRYELESTAIFGEVYWDVIPEEFKVTLGLRQTKDEKHTIGQQTILSVYGPIGLQNNDPALVASGFDADPSQPGAQLVADQVGEFEATTGRLVLTWTPTKENMVYASFARGFKSGGINPPLSAALSAVPQTFAPELIDAYELGTKNTLFDGTLQANATAWYYEYQDYQVSKIVNRTSVNENISAKLWGLEGELLYVPSPQWAFNLTVTNTHSEIGPSFSIDQRNPTNGVAGTTWVKDIGSGANCVMVRRPTSLLAPGIRTPADASKPGFYLPPGGSAAIAAYGIPGANFGRCDQPGLYDPTTGTDLDFMYTPDSGGIAVNLEGNKLPQVPDSTIAFGAQYTHPIATGVDVTFRVDYYWQDEMWTRIFNRDPIDKIDPWGVLNAHIILTSEDGWYAKVFATNLLDDREITNSYLTDASSGLFTNVFVTDPRIIGASVGVEF